MNGIREAGKNEEEKLKKIFRRKGKKIVKSLKVFLEKNLKAT